jgi:hypothetical protein
METLQEQLESWREEGFFRDPRAPAPEDPPLKQAGQPAASQVSPEALHAAGHSVMAYLCLARAVQWQFRTRRASLASLLRGATLARPFEPGMRKRLHQTVNAYRLIQTWTYAHGECLPRAVLLARALRYQGIPSDICFGVRKLPFSAHAWVEADGEVLSDSTSFTSQFRIVARV